MNPFSHNRFLGYLNEVTPQYVRIHFPASKLLKKFHHEGLDFLGGSVGNFVVIEGDEYGFLARLTDIGLPDSERKEVTEKAILEDESIFHPSGKAELLLSFNIFDPNILEKTVGRYPHIGAKVYACSDEQIAGYIQRFGGKEDGNAFSHLGMLTNNNAKCNISLDALFGRHCAIVGTTGGGKSWTVAKLIECVYHDTSNKVILIDATGEYDNINNAQHCIVGKDAYYSFSELTNSDFCFLFREHSPNTSTILCEAINTLRLHEAGVIKNRVKAGQRASDLASIISSNISDHIKGDFDISLLYSQIRNECVKEKNNALYEEDAFKLGYSSHLMARVNLFLQNETVKAALGIDSRVDKNDLSTQIEEFLSNDYAVLRISFEALSYDFAIREIIVDFISKQLLSIARSQRLKDNPVVFFVDEAHQFLNKRISADDDTSFYLQGIELIAKEARKYGLFLCLSTQMPRDIPIGVLSQMGSFIVHRLINEMDKKAIENAASSVNRNSIAFLPTLGAGEALLIGVDFPMPLLLKVEPPVYKPNSATPVLKKRNLRNTT